MVEYKKLNEIATIINGYAFKSSKYITNGYRVIRITNVQKGFLCDDDPKYYAQEKSLSKYELFEKDILISLTGNVGRVGFVEKDILPAYLNQRVGCIRINSETILPRYLFHFLNNDLFEQMCIKEAKGIAQLNLSTEWLKNVRVRVPSLEDQQRIVNILDKAEEIRTKKKLANEKLDEFLKSTFIDMFGDPVTNPKGFAIKNLKDFYFDDKAVKCGPFGSALKKSEYVQKGIPVWNMDNITIKSEFIPKPNLYITEQKFNELQSYTAINNDIIISRAGTVGKMCVLEGLNSATIISTNLIRLRLNKSKLSPIWFIKLLEYNGNKVCRLKRGCDGAFTHMNTGILDNIYFPYPEIDSQNLYVEIYKRVKAQKEKNQKVIEQMDNLFNSLMQQAFNGEM